MTYILPYKGTRQHLLTLQVSRFCIIMLHSKNRIRVSRCGREMCGLVRKLVAPSPGARLIRTVIESEFILKESNIVCSLRLFRSALQSLMVLIS